MKKLEFKLAGPEAFYDYLDVEAENERRRELDERFPHLTPLGPTTIEEMYEMFRSSARQDPGRTFVCESGRVVFLGQVVWVNLVEVPEPPASWSAS